MPNYARMLISLPLLAVPFLALPLKSAIAETVGVERAIELLSKSAAVDAKCKVLNSAERDELSRYTSRAEVSGAEKTSVESTRAALAAGKKAGQATACGALASADVKDTLAAAREAIKAVTMRAAPAKPTVAVAAAAEAKPGKEAVSKKPAPGGELSNYSRVTQAYYLERRCTYLSKSQINAFYKAVLKTHLAAISTFGKSAVSSVKRAAEAQATALSCNGAGEALVRASYAEMAAR
jgi:hypothetical protein